MYMPDEAEITAIRAALRTARTGDRDQACRQFIARVFYESPDRIIIEFTTPGGDSFSYVFNVCQ